MERSRNGKLHSLSSRKNISHPANAINISGWSHTEWYTVIAPKEIVQTVLVDTPHIKIELYDNAEIDDDTVSVFLNNTLLLHKKRLTDKPLVLSISAFPNTDYELMMYAENLGRIPPNTSLMIVTAGKKRYEMRISSNEQKNAVVRFRYAK